jgi:hypothetical protein
MIQGASLFFTRIPGLLTTIFRGHSTPSFLPAVPAEVSPDTGGAPGEPVAWKSREIYLDASRRGWGPVGCDDLSVSEERIAIHQ